MIITVLNFTTGTIHHINNVPKKLTECCESLEEYLIELNFRLQDIEYMVQENYESESIEYEQVYRI